MTTERGTPINTLLCLRALTRPRSTISQLDRRYRVFSENLSLAPSASPVNRGEIQQHLCSYYVITTDARLVAEY